MINHIKSCRQIEKYQGWNFLFIDCKKKIILDTKKGSFSGMKLPICRLEGSNWWEWFQVWWYTSMNVSCRNEAGATQEKRPDGGTLFPWRRGRCVTWDVTVVDTHAAFYVGIRLYGLAPQPSGPLRGKSRSTDISKKIIFHSTGTWCSWCVEWSRFNLFWWCRQKNFRCNWWLQRVCLFVSEVVYCPQVLSILSA